MRWSLLGLVAGGCIRVGDVAGDVFDVETYWVDERFEGPLSFAEGELAREVAIAATLDWAVPDPDDIQSDAFRVGVDGLAGAFDVTFLVDGVEVTDPARLREFPDEGANLVGVFAGCEGPPPCATAATARISRALDAAAEATILVEAILSVDDLFGETPPPDAATLTVDAGR